MNPIPFGPTGNPVGLGRSVVFVDVDTIALVVGDEPWLIDQGAFVRADAGAAVRGVFSMPPSDVWWTLDTGFVRFRGTTRRFFPAPSGVLKRGPTSDTVWLESGPSTSRFDEASGFVSVQLPPMGPAGCMSLRSLAPLSPVRAGALCDIFPSYTVWQLATSPSLLVEPDAGRTNSFETELFPLSADELALVTLSMPPPTNEPEINLRLFLDGGFAPLTPPPPGFGPLRFSSDGQVFGLFQTGVHRLVGGAWANVATPTSVLSNPIDLFGDSVLFSTGLLVGTFSQGLTTTFTRAAIENSCTGLSRGPHVAFVCGSTRYEAPGGWLHPLPGNVAGTPLALDASGNLWHSNGNSVVRLTPAGSSASYTLVAPTFRRRAAIADTGDAWAFSESPPNVRVAHFKPAAATSFTAVATFTDTLSWDEAAPFGDGALATLGRRALEFFPDGGHRELIDAGTGSQFTALCVVSRDEYAAATAFPPRLFLRVDGGTQELSQGSSGLACAPGRLVNGSVPVVGPAFAPPPLDSTQIIMRDDGAMWGLSTSNHIVFRPAR